MRWQGSDEGRRDRAEAASSIRRRRRPSRPGPRADRAPALELSGFGLPQSLGSPMSWLSNVRVPQSSGHPLIECQAFGYAIIFRYKYIYIFLIFLELSKATIGEHGSFRPPRPWTGATGATAATGGFAGSTVSPLAGRGQGEGPGVRIAKADRLDESREAWGVAGKCPGPSPQLSPRERGEGVSAVAPVAPVHGRIEPKTLRAAAKSGRARRPWPGARRPRGSAARARWPIRSAARSPAAAAAWR